MLCLPLAIPGAAPRASCSGLSVRDYAGGRWIRIERHMADDEALLFCGDPIAFVSAHHFSACMHRPDAHANHQNIS